MGHEGKWEGGGFEEGKRGLDMCAFCEIVLRMQDMKLE